MATDAQPGPYIEFKEVSKAFGENRVLDHVSFDVMPAETVCILGRSGVGKSVTLQNIMGFLKPDEGRVFVAGRRYYRLFRGGTAANPQESHHGVPERRVV